MGKKPTVLVATSRYPFPVRGGDQLRIVEICRALSSSYRLTLLSLIRPSTERKVEEEEALFAAVHLHQLSKARSIVQALVAVPSTKPMNLAYYWSGSFRRQLSRLSENHDAVLAHLIRVGQYIDAVGSHAILEMTDALSLRYDRLHISLDLTLLQWAYILDSGRVRRVERELAEQFDATVVVSREDKEAVESNRSEGRVAVISNGVDSEVFGYVGPGRKPSALFIGKLASEANIEACERFAEEVVPLIRRSIPDFHLNVIGYATEKAHRRLQRLTGVRLLGFQEDIQSAAEGCLCGVCYMEYGGGIQNKILNYMALGLPSVVTPTAAEGIEATDGPHWYIERSAQTFADRIIWLYQSPRRAYEMGKNARELVLESCTWESQLEQYRGIVAEVLGDSKNGK